MSEDWEKAVRKTSLTPDLDRWAENLATLPVWAFHGANDKVVPADRSERMITLIRDKGGKSVRLTVFPNEGHGASRQVYTSREFFEWLFAQSAGGRRKRAGRNEKAQAVDTVEVTSTVPGQPGEFSTLMTICFTRRLHRLRCRAGSKSNTVSS